MELAGTNYFEKRRKALSLPDLSKDMPFREKDWGEALQLYSPFLLNIFKGKEIVRDVDPLSIYSFLEKEARVEKGELESFLSDRIHNRLSSHNIHIVQKSIFCEILLLDLYRVIPFSRIVFLISLLAKIIVSLVLESVWEDEMEASPAVIGMGKLGGMELNYSSDIDLVFVSSEEQDPYLMTSVIQRLLKKLAEKGPAGFLYRVDARLRPQGDSGGALVRTTESYMRYYWMSGQTWERQALLKASFLCGNEKLGDKFIKKVQEFIFFHHTTPKEIREIRDIKGLIEEGLVKSQDEDRNIKLMSGGIRDIEFLIQFIQLHHGYVYQDVRPANHLEASTSLAKHGFLSEVEARILNSAYIFFREIEHRLQCLHFAPVRILPTGDENWERLSFSFVPYMPVKKFQVEVAELRKFVQNAFHKRLNETISYLEKYQEVFYFLESYDTNKISHYLHGLRDEYVDFFTPLQIADHYNRLLKLSYSYQSDVYLDPHPDDLPDKWEVNLVAIDRPFAFSFLVGELAIAGLELIHARSYTYRSKIKASFEQDMSDIKAIPMISYFVILGNKAVIQPWTKKIAGIIQGLDPQNPKIINEAKMDLRRRFFARPDGQVKEKDESQDFQVKTFMQLGSNQAILEIRGRDYPGFLFESITALQEMGIKILECSIETSGKAAYDRFLITRLDDKPILDGERQSVEQKISLMKFFSRHLGKVADPALAYTRFFDLMGRVSSVKGEKGDEAESSNFKYSDRLLEKIGLLLGSGEFVRQRFFLSEGLKFLRLAEGSGRFNVDEELNKLGKIRDSFRKKYLSNDKFMNFRGEIQLSIQIRLNQDLAYWREGALYEVCLAQIQENIPFDLLSVYFDKIISSYLEAFLKLNEEILVRKRGGDWGKWHKSTRWALWALGKFGGRELGYGSDLEVVFVSDDKEKRSPDIWIELIQKVIHELPNKSRNLFNIDLRLRPYGNSGSLVTSLSHVYKYYQDGGGAHAFERQALIKGRTIIFREGDTQVFEGININSVLETIRQNFTFSDSKFPVSAILDLHTEQLRGAHENDLKYGEGGLAEIEYSVQIIQMAGASQGIYRKNRDLFSASTLRAIDALHGIGKLTYYESSLLRQNYCLYRIVINALRFSIGRDNSYIMPELDSPHWERLIRLVQKELRLSGSRQLRTLLESARMNVSHWWKTFEDKLPPDWIST